MIQAWGNYRAYRGFRALPNAWRRIVIYSESGQDWHHFSPVIAALNSRGERVCYLTSDPADVGLQQNDPHLRAFCIGSGLVRTLCFQFLDVGVMLMTMVDFNNLQLKRSINPVTYAFMFHSLVSVHMADHADSYDHYDAVLCAGPHQLRELRKREELLQQPAKQLFAHGYQRLEDLMQEQRPPPAWQTDRDIHVLLAPSWGEQTLLNVCGQELVDELLAAGFKVTLRPHYQTRWTTPELIDRIAAAHANDPQFTLLEQMGESASLFDSHVMITDWSGAGMDYGMGLEKPVLYIDVPPKARNDWWPELGLEPFEMYVRDQVGAVVSPAALSTVPERIRALLADPGALQNKIGALREDWVFNLGSSAAAAADAVQELARQSDALHANALAGPGA
jgi:hypothetical protein